MLFIALGGYDHGHNGVFYGLGKTVTNKFFYLIAHTAGYDWDKLIWDGQNSVFRNKHAYIVSSQSPSLSNTFNDIIYKFNKNGAEEYKGSFINYQLNPEIRWKITSTAASIVNEDPVYGFCDMIDPNGCYGLPSWLGGEEWHGRISEIDEIRCDGYTEFSYEKNGASVFDENIAANGLSKVYNHNNFHGVWEIIEQNEPELCPAIQANLTWKNHGDNLHGLSVMRPSVVSKPEATFPVVTTKNIMRYNHTWITEEIRADYYYPYIYDYTESYWESIPLGTAPGVQLQFDISDNASVYCFVLVQAKLSSESVWHTIKDNRNPDENVWEWQTLELPEYTWDCIQKGRFFIQWLGETVGGPTYSQAQMRQCNFRVIPIDQGGNIGDAPVCPQPSAPQNFQYLGPNGENPKFGWNSCPETNISEYIVYRKQGSGSYQQIAQTSNTNWTDYDIILLPQGNNYTYYVKAKNVYNAYSSASNTAGCTGIMKQSADSAYTKNNNVDDNLVSGVFPNPFNQTVIIRFQLEQDCFVQLQVFDVSGKRVADLVNSYWSAGEYSEMFNGAGLSSGLYFYKLNVGSKSILGRMLLVK